MRASSAVRVLTLITLSALLVMDVNQGKEQAESAMVRVRHDKNEKDPYLILSASTLAASLNVAASSPRVESGCFVDDRCALAARESGGGRYPRLLCSSDMMIRASLAPTLPRSMVRAAVWIRFASSSAATLRTWGSMVPVVVSTSVVSLDSAGLSVGATTVDTSTGGALSATSGLDLYSSSVAWGCEC